ncbi:MAG: hypothetical protein JWO41_450 [Candidatus Saccharibacteria bacterium]|nr:hypothetical protein [Candidatus Saccharibacteria bacterium]
MINIEHGGLTLIGALQRYKIAWRNLVQEYHLEDFEEFAIPTTISWKVADKDHLYEALYNIRKETEQVHIGTVNDRFIASVVLKQPFEDDLWIIKVLERRVASKDALGLDSIDYLVPDLEQTYQGLKAAGLPVVKEHNDVHAWLSLRFGNNDQFEAKFTDHLVIAVAQKELKLDEDKILKILGK